MDMRRLQAAADEADIRRVVYRYCRGIDRMDRELVRSCYHAGARDSHGTWHGPVEEFIEWSFTMLGRYDLTMHFVGNVLVEFEDEDTAQVESYAIAFHRSSSPKPSDNLTIGCRYLDRFERRHEGPHAGEWRIADRVAVAEWLEVSDRANWVPIAENVLRGRRDRSDEVYRRASGTPGSVQAGMPEGAG